MQQVRINQPLLGEGEAAAVLEAMRSGVLTDSGRAGGPMVRRFEGAVRERTGSRHCVAVSSGTAALWAAITALEISGGIMMPSFTHASTANAAHFAGCRPAFADIDPETYTMDAARPGPGTAGIIPVHLYGHVAGVGPYLDAHVPVTEDAAQAPGSRGAGRTGHAGIFSFYPGKVCTTGEGGAVICDDAGLYERLPDVRNHGAGETPGMNLRMPETCAAMGRVQMGRLDGFLERRRHNARMLCDLLGESVAAPEYDPDCNYGLFTVSSPRRDAIRAALHGRGIQAATYYDPPVHALGRFPYAPLPNTESAAGRVPSIPVHPGVTDGTIHEMCRTIRDACWGDARRPGACGAPAAA